VLLTLLEGLQANEPAAALSKYFHDWLIAALTHTCCAAREQTGLATVALSGGVFNNRYLAEQLPGTLKTAGFTVLTHRELPPNDGGIAYGQMAVARAQKLLH
jgi:hydrogenase maturation protein HypF